MIDPIIGEDIENLRHGSDSRLKIPVQRNGNAVK